MNICSKCGKQFKEPPALSRRDKSKICSSCGTKEALEDAIKAGMVFTEEDVAGIIDTVENYNSNK